MPVAAVASVIRTAASGPLAFRNKLHDRGIEMNPVRDDVGGEPRIGQHFAQNSGIAMIQRPHGVEGVSGMASARGDAGASRVQVSVGVPQAHANSARGGLRDDLERARQFRRNREHANVSSRRLPEAIKSGQRRSQQIFRRMHSAPLVADEWSFQMNPQRPRPQIAVSSRRGSCSAASIASANRARAESVASSGAVTVVGK